MQKRGFVVLFLFLISMLVGVYATHEEGHIDEAVVTDSGASAGSVDSESIDAEVVEDEGGAILDSERIDEEENSGGLSSENDGLSDSNDNDELNDGRINEEGNGVEPSGENDESSEERINENDQLAELDNEYRNAQLQEGAGITPDSGLYFVEDVILSKFRDDLENREKKVAEIKAMVESGDMESAQLALERYRMHADKLEKEIEPEKRREARRSAAAIRNTLREIEDEIPEDARMEFVGEIREREEKIVTAVEIAGKIKELCGQLSDLDPLEYERVCKTSDDAPEWQRKLHRDLSEEQEKEAREFFGIMSQCMKTSGRECRCQDISVSAFADQCSIVAPLAAACDDGNDEACEQMEEQTEGIEELLPDYLQDVMMRVEGKFEEDRFDMHMPEECREAGAKTPKECMKVMIKVNAPPECVEELEKSNVQNEREARKICEEIMFKQNAPQECIDAGLRDHRECGKLMFQQNAPQECIDAGLTGESPSDGKKCGEMMHRLGGDGRGSPGPRGFGGGNCRGIENAEERLKCYDDVSKGLGEDYEHREPFRGWPSQCEEKGATTRESCEVVMREWGESQRQEFRRVDEGFREHGDFRAPPDCEGLSPEECRMKFEERRGEFGSPSGCEGLSPEECRMKFEERGEFTPPPDGFEGMPPPPEGFMSPEGEVSPVLEPTLDPVPASEPTPTPLSEPAPATEPVSEPTPEPAPSGDSGITGGMVFENLFLDYYFK